MIQRWAVVMGWRGVLVLSALMALVLAESCTRSNAGYIAGERCSDNPDVCTDGTVCDAQAGICVCAPNTTLCGTSCVDFNSDADHCGGCDLACPAGESCQNGRCSGGGCAGGATECGGRCVDTQSNPYHCGGCRDGQGQRCGDGQECVDGSCRESSCAFGATRCGDRCVSLASDPAHCGECGKRCDAGDVCVDGACESSCPPRLTLCGTECVDLRHDPANCGRCGERCNRDEICARDDGRPRCREYRFAGCNSCPCALCGERRCCAVPIAGGGVQLLCVEDGCPARR